MGTLGQRRNVERDSRILMLYQQGEGYRKISKKMNLTESTVSSVLRRNNCYKTTETQSAKIAGIEAMKRKGMQNKEIAEALDMHPATVSSYVQLYLPHENEQIATPSIMATMKEKHAFRNVFQKEARILLCFDPHIPYTYAPAMRAALAAEGSFDLAIVGGDELDQTRFSRFRPDEAASVADELKMACDIEDQLQKKCGMVWKIRGNHDERFRKMVLDRLGEVINRMHKDAQKQLMDAVDQVERWHHDRNKNGIMYHADFWVMTGNKERPNVIAHPDRYRNQQYATVKAFRGWLRQHDINPGSICIGHLHRYVPWAPDEGVWISEMPALCQRMAYMASAKAYGGALHTGYGILVQDKNGRFVPNESKCVFVEAL